MRLSGKLSSPCTRRYHQQMRSGRVRACSLSVNETSLIVLVPLMESMLLFRPLQMLAQPFITIKGRHSIVLMAVCDAHYRFILVDVGDASQHSDGGVLSNSDFSQALEDGTLGLPSD